MRCHVCHALPCVFMLHDTEAQDSFAASPVCAASFDVAGLSPHLDALHALYVTGAHMRATPMMAPDAMCTWPRPALPATAAACPAPLAPCTADVPPMPFATELTSSCAAALSAGPRLAVRCSRPAPAATSSSSSPPYSLSLSSKLDMLMALYT